MSKKPNHPVGKVHLEVIGQKITNQLQLVLKSPVTSRYENVPWKVWFGSGRMKMLTTAALGKPEDYPNLDQCKKLVGLFLLVSLGPSKNGKYTDVKKLLSVSTIRPKSILIPKLGSNDRNQVSPEQTPISK